MRRIGSKALILLLFSTGSVIQAGVVYNISINTGALVGHTAGPFSLDFQLNDGSGTGDGNNTATLSNFLFGGGNATGSPTLTGGASGNITSGVNLVDNNFFDQFIQGFTPGGSLSFQLSLTTNVDSGGTPDEFSFAILDSSLTELPTVAPSFFDVFVLVDITSSNPTIQTYASDTSRRPNAGGPAINVAAPTATQVSTVPEPETFMLLVPFLVAIGLGVRFRGTRTAHMQ